MWDRHNLLGRCLDLVAADNIESQELFNIWARSRKVTSCTNNFVILFSFCISLQPQFSVFYQCETNLPVFMVCTEYTMWAIEKYFLSIKDTVLTFLLATIFICTSIWRCSTDCIMSWISVVSHFTTMVVTTFLLFLRDV